MKKIYLFIFVILILCLVIGCSSAQNSMKAQQTWPDDGRVIVDPQSGKSYFLQKVFVPSGSHLIASTFMRPANSVSAPVMLVVSGSRDGILTAESPLHRSLLAQGIAVLTLGKKGVSPSTGNWENETFYNRASNVVAALDWLNTRNDVNGQEVVIYAHSQGAYVTPLMADDPRVQALVLAAAPAEIVRQQIYTDKVESDTRKGKSAIRATTAATRQQRFLDMLTHVCPVYKVHYLCHIYNFDPKPALEKLTKPVLVLYAGNDPMVPHHKNLPLMQAFLKHNNKAQFSVIPGGNHMFWHSTTGLPEEYISLRGPVAAFPFADPNNSEHERLANLFANRVKQSPGYQEAVEDFVKRIFENQLSKMAESNSL